MKSKRVRARNRRQNLEASGEGERDVSERVGSPESTEVKVPTPPQTRKPNQHALKIGARLLARHRCL